MGILNDEDRKRDEEYAHEDRMASQLFFDLKVIVANSKVNDAQRAALRSILRQQLAELSIKLSLFVPDGTVRVKLELINPRYGSREMYPEVDEVEDAAA